MCFVLRGSRLRLFWYRIWYRVLVRVLINIMPTSQCSNYFRCGSSIRAGAASAPSSDCSTPCSGKCECNFVTHRSVLIPSDSIASDICGNNNRISLYKSGTSASSSASSSATPTSSSSSTSATPTSTSLSYAPLGCYNDPGDARVLNGGMTSSSSQTVAGCASSCAAQGFAYFGTEYGSECWCVLCP